MFLMKNNLMPIVKKQYLYKLQTCSRLFVVMIIFQIVGMIFSISGLSGMSATSDETLTITFLRNTTIQIFIFTSACVIGGAINLNLREAKNIDFTFISNRISSNLSSIAILITYALFGAITFPLAACFIRIVKYLLIGSSNIIERGFFITLRELFCCSGTTFLYVLLFSSAAYFSTILVEKTRAFLIVLLAVIVLLPRTEFFTDIINFYGSEYSFLLFTVKVIFTSIIFFLASVLVSNNMEVRR